MANILFLGDLLYDYDTIHKDIQEIGHFFQKNNYYTVINLEAPLISQNPKKKWINLYNNECIIDVLQMLNVIAVDLANNHIMDWEEDGLRALINHLEQAGIQYFGAGQNLDEAVKPMIIEKNDIKIGLAGFGWSEEMCVPASSKKAGIAPLNNKIIEKTIQSMKSHSVDKIVINLHWGYEYEFYPLPIHRQLAHRIVDMGADLIIGHHAHVIQAIEKYNNVNIFYGLGNFYFGSRRRIFNTCNNIISQMYSRYGLGVVWNERQFKPILFDSDDNYTRIVDFEIHNFIDISPIKMKDYNAFFKMNRVSTRKPSLFISKISWFTVPVKLYRCKLKESLIKLIVFILEKIKLKEFVKNTIKKKKIKFIQSA
jgi:poly-gamma-glutamate capsule biosynthesis protein CapA/YwtB (metallophosphatase superfamily)